MFIAKMILLNHLHLFFTPLMMLSTRTGLTWVNTEGYRNKIIVFAATALVSAFLILTFGDSFSKRVFLASWIAWSTFHTCRQLYGMSQHFRKQNDIPRKKSDFALFHLVILIYTFYAFSREMGYLTKETFLSLLQPASLVFLLAYLVLPFFRSKAGSKSILEYDIKLLVWPFMFVNLFCSFALLSLHGIEYFLISKNYVMNEKERNGLLIKALVILSGLFLSIYLIKLSEFSFIRPHIPKYLIKNELIFNALLSLSFTCSAFHFWMDGIIFDRRKTNSFIFMANKIYR